MRRDGRADDAAERLRFAIAMARLPLSRPPAFAGEPTTPGRGPIWTRKRYAENLNAGEA